VFSVPLDVILSKPNLVAEIASPSTRRRDATIKRDTYERFIPPDARPLLGSQPISRASAAAMR